MILGTTGYEAAVPAYLKATQDLPFEQLHQDFLPFFPTTPSLILDIGAGGGRDAHALSLKGHRVLAVEPLAAFREAGQALYPSAHLTWIDDALPFLKELTAYNNTIDFALCSAVWHHLDEREQKASMIRMGQLLKPGGIFALSLRNGPAGVGTHVFPTDLKQTSAQARIWGLETLLAVEDQPSLMPNKPDVIWAKLVLRKSLA